MYILNRVDRKGIFNMKRISLQFAAILIINLLISQVMAQKSKEIDLNFGWRFAKGEHPGAYKKDFDDSQWRLIDVPHDWSIEDLSEESGPYDKTAVGQWDVGYVVGGKGWYRKKIELNKDDEGKIIHLQFDGVYMNADVWVNDYHAGSRAYGYSTFWFDITPYVEFGQKNVMVVEVKNIGSNSRWYSGSGIFRPVSLRIMDKIHISHWGTAVRIKKASSSLAEVNVITKVTNKSDKDVTASLLSVIKDDKGRVVASTQSKLKIRKISETQITDIINLKKPQLWSIEIPYLYTLIQNVTVAGELVDQRETTFGIRTITYNAKEGFLLNDKPVLLKGSCMHHDNYMLGSAAFSRAEERRVELTKAAGYNAIRCAHNPPSQAFLDACDRFGVLVIDEAFDQWTIHKWDHDQDYGRHFQEWWHKDVESMVLRDRNHPSIIMWSLGNEIPEQGSEYGIFWARQIKGYVKELDPSRPVTMGINKSGPNMDKFFQELDVVGYNYRLNTYESDQERVPDRVSYGSESFSRDAFKYWQKVEELPYIIGDFVWTGWDYLGEASIGWSGYGKNWERLGYYPWHAAYCGEIDLTGYKRPAAYYRDVLWKTGQNKVSAFVKSPEPSLQPPPDSSWNLYWTYPDLHPSWTWSGNEGNELEVVVYSACDEVELFLNGKSLGRKATSVKTEYKENWVVVYEPGELKAIGYNHGEQQAEWVLKTAGAPKEIKLTADRIIIKANGCDLSYITAELLDEYGNRVYDWKEDILINFEIRGEGKLAGVGNANPTNTESYQKPQRCTFRGRCFVVLKSTLNAGTITLNANAQGLKGDSISIQTSNVETP
jgi:beta-galactosidase